LGSFGYPILLWVWAQLAPRRTVESLQRLPTVSVVLPCYNEAPYIAAKIENLLGLAYPAELLELVLVCDGSTDRTAAIVSSFLPHPQLRLFELSQRHGKPNALNTGVAAATGELILFSDSRQLFNAGALQALVSHFADPQVGAVSGTLLDFGHRPGERSGKRFVLGAWFRQLENRLKIWESQIHSVVGVYGALYAIRRSLYRPLPVNVILDDMAVPFSIIEQGYRVSFEPAAQAIEPSKPSPTIEIGRRRRIFTGNFQFMCAGNQLYRFRTNPILVQWLLHKGVRMVFPFLIAQLFVANLFIAGPFYDYLLLAQLSVHALCLVGMVFKKPAFFYLFSQFNISVLRGFHAAVTKSYSVKWQKQT